MVDKYKGHPYFYESYSFSPTATGLSKELAQKKSRRENGNMLLKVALGGGFVIDSIIMMACLEAADSLSIHSNPVAVVVLLALSVAIPIVIGVLFKIISEARDLSDEEFIVETLERDARKIPEYSESYSSARATARAKRAIYDKMAEESIGNRIKNSLEKVRESLENFILRFKKSGFPGEEKANLPEFLVKSKDKTKRITRIQNNKCKYSVEMYNERVEKIPGVTNNGSYPIDEYHVYSRSGSKAWYVISTMKTPLVRKTPLENSVMSPYTLSQSFRMPEAFLHLPAGRDYKGYISIKMESLGSFPNYAFVHGLDEAQVFHHTFILGDTGYGDYILVARKGDYSWRLEVIAPQESEEISHEDNIQAGAFFGTFRPLW